VHSPPPRSATGRIDSRLTKIGAYAAHGGRWCDDDRDVISARQTTCVRDRRPLRFEPRAHSDARQRCSPAHLRFRSLPKACRSNQIWRGDSSLQAPTCTCGAFDSTTRSVISNKASLDLAGSRNTGDRHETYISADSQCIEPWNKRRADSFSQYGRGCNCEYTFSIRNRQYYVKDYYLPRFILVSTSRQSPPTVRHRTRPRGRPLEPVRGG
jgi:hypothetical protein